MASIAMLAEGEKLCTQSLTHPAYLMPREPKHLRFGTSLQNMSFLQDERCLLQDCISPEVRPPTACDDMNTSSA